MRISTIIIYCAAALMYVAPIVQANSEVLSEAQKSFDQKDYATVIALAEEEISKNPGYEEAYILLAQAYEAQGNSEKALEAWGNLKKITKIPERLHMARIGLLRVHGPFAPPEVIDADWEDDPFKVEIRKIDWAALEENVKNVKAEYLGVFPKYRVSTRHFEVFACTSMLAQSSASLAEDYLNFLLGKYLDGPAWALRIPILIYKNHDDYVQKGKNSASSAGGMMFDPRLGKPLRITMYALDEDGNLDRDALEGTMPHEITHMVTHEFFGAQNLPRWLDEGMSRRSEQTRKHYEEASKTGRDAVAGEYFRFRELFELERYPSGHFRNWRFYEQSATIVLYLLEQGPDSASAFLQSLKDGQDYNEAVANALGIPVEGAVEELEKRWVLWMRDCYVRYKDKLAEEQPTLTGEDLGNDYFTQSLSELATVEAIEKWHPVRTNSMNSFKGVNDSANQWGINNNKLSFLVDESESESLLAVRTDDEKPMSIRFKARAHNGTASDPTALGISMLDHRADDTGIQVVALLNDRQPHTITCIINDEISIYVDGVCTGRAEALQTEWLDEDIDHPFAFATSSAVDISDIETGSIEKFVTVIPQEEEKEKGNKRRGRRR